MTFTAEQFFRTDQRCILALKRALSSPPLTNRDWGDWMHKASVLDTQGLQPTAERLRDALKRRHPRHTAKLVARDTGADVRTVENWLRIDNPQPPIWRHFEAMVLAYGPGLAIEVFAQDTDLIRQLERSRAIERLEREIADLKAEERPWASR